MMSFSVHVPDPPLLFAHVTLAIPDASLAVPATVNGDTFVVYVDADVGDVIVTVGGVVSAVVG
jgi:hypothetical protein